MPVRSPKKKADDKAGLSAIKCSSCGTEILLVPNVKIMSEAIESHVSTHMQKIKDPKEAEAEAERIRDDLIMQILDKAAKQ